MTVHGEDDSRDPTACALILFFRDGEGYQLGCAEPVAGLAEAFISYVQHMNNPVCFFLSENGQPAILFFAEEPTQAYLLFYALPGRKSFKTRRDAFCPENGL